MAAPPSHPSGVGHDPSPFDGCQVFRRVFSPLPSFLFVFG
ncbi:hypothetical protein A2U01_0115590, partial [Trifolium medium]|nr:hypothetical protein [Trifolium medium]